MKDHAMLFISLTILSLLLLIFLRYYSKSVASKPRLYGNLYGKWRRKLEKKVPSLHKVFYPCWWCPWGIPQTLLRVLLRSLPKLPFEREIVELADGGQLALDFLHPKGVSKSIPVLLMIPGMTSSTYDCAYILHSARIANEKGFRVAVMNCRGLGDVPLKTARTFCPLKTDDVEIVIKIINRRYPNARKLGAGFSLGGMLLWNYMYTHTKETVGLNAGMLISTPWNPIEASFINEKFWPRILFNKFLSGVLKNYIKPYKHLFEHKFNWEQAMNLKSVREYDQFVTAPLYGFNDWCDYYHQASLYHKHKLHNIPVPVLCLHAADDCFSPLKSIPLNEIQKLNNVCVVTTKHGGHLAFMKYTNPGAIGFDEELLSEITDLVFSNEFDSFMV